VSARWRAISPWDLLPRARCVGGKAAESDRSAGKNVFDRGDDRSDGTTIWFEVVEEEALKKSAPSS
jgi:hypothetical protein